MEVSLWSITSRLCLTKQQKRPLSWVLWVFSSAVGKCVEWGAWLSLLSRPGEEPPALQQSSGAHALPPLLPQKPWTECPLHRVASSFKDQNFKLILWKVFVQVKYIFYEHPAWALKLLGFLCVSVSVPGPAMCKLQWSTAVWIGPDWAPGGGGFTPLKQRLGPHRSRSDQKAPLWWTSAA